MVSWLPVRAALARLTHAQDHFLVNSTWTSRRYPDDPGRHAKAMDRKDWSLQGLRPADQPRGRRQARLLVPMLAAYGITRLVSSTSTRCLTHRRTCPARSGSSPMPS